MRYRSGKSSAARVGFRVALLSASLVACSKNGPPIEHSPPYQHKLGDGINELHSALPQETRVVIDVSLEHLRARETLTPLLSTLFSELAPLLGRDGSQVRIDQLTIAMVAVEEGILQPVFLLRGDDARPESFSEFSNTEQLAKGILLIAAPSAAKLFHESARGAVDHDGFLELRDRSVPEGAQSALLRVAGLLNKSESIALAGRLRVDHVPAKFSMWLDVADDAALVLFVENDGDVSAKESVVVLRKLLSRFAKRYLPSGRSRWSDGGKTGVLTWVLGPKALARWVGKITQVSSNAGATK